MNSDKIPPRQKQAKAPPAESKDARPAPPPKSQFENMAISLQSTFEQHPLSGAVGVRPPGTREDGIDFLSKKNRKPPAAPPPIPGATADKGHATPRPYVHPEVGQVQPTVAIPQDEYLGAPVRPYVYPEVGQVQPTVAIPQDEYLGTPQSRCPTMERPHLEHPIAPEQNRRPVPTIAAERTVSEDSASPTPNDLDAWRKPENPKDPFCLLNTTLQGKYEITGFIGKGGMGAVYLARHKFLGKNRAIKTLQKSTSVNSNLVKRFFTEARAAAAVEHPNIVQVHDIDETDNFYFIVMEYVDGESLDDRMRRTGILPIQEAIHVVKGAALGLAAIHNAGMVHRDIKPGNLLLGPEGETKITDFGIVKEIGGDTQLTGATIIGTPQFMAPEQITKDGLDGRTDMYSLGATFYYFLTNQHCFTGNAMQLIYQIVNCAPIPPHELDSKIDPKISEIILKMLAKKPHDRYQSLEEVHKVLQQF